MKNILFIAPYIGFGGAELSLIQTIKMLSEDNENNITLYVDGSDISALYMLPENVRFIYRDFDVHPYRSISVCGYSILAKSCRLFSSKKEKYYNKKLVQAVSDKKDSLVAKRYFSNEHFDAVFCNLAFARSGIIKYVSADRKFLIFHGSRDTHHKQLEVLLPFLSGLVGVSPGAVEMLKGAFPKYESIIRCVPNYIDFDSVSEKSKNEVTDIKTHMGILKLCTCGRLSSEKGMDLAITAASILKCNGVRFKWYFVGDGPEKDVLETLISKFALEEEVVFLGNKENPYPYIKLCDIYVQPSYEESFGRAIREAQILGKPIVSTETVGAQYLLGSGEKGILTDISAQGLATGIKSLTDDPEKYKSLVGIYTREDNEKEKEIFKTALEDIMSR